VRITVIGIKRVFRKIIFVHISTAYTKDEYYRPRDLGLLAITKKA